MLRIVTVVSKIFRQSYKRKFLQIPEILMSFIETATFRYGVLIEQYIFH